MATDLDVHAYVLFTGSGPILLLATYASPIDDAMVQKLEARGIRKFLAYEVELPRVEDTYAERFTRVVQDLGEGDIRVLDYNSWHVFHSFSFADLKNAVNYEPSV